METRIVVATMVLFTLVAASSHAATPEPNSFAICNSSGEQTWPAISGRYVVWQDFRLNNKYNIYRNDPANDSNTTGVAIAYKSNAHQKFPAISGTMVVWEDFRTATNSPNIYTYNLPSGPATALNLIIGDQTYPAISGTNIVWQDTYTDAGDIYCNGTPSGVCVLGLEQSYPAISGNIVVWQDYRNENWDIYGKNIQAGTNLVIKQLSGSDQCNPAVSDNNVVWQDSRNGGWDIYGKDIDGQEFEICKYAGRDQINPAISGDIVVWEDYRNGTSNADIYGCRISTKEVFAICKSAGNQKNPAIDGNFVVWEDYRFDGSGDIYGAYIAAPSTITVLDPNGGEMLLAGSKYLIKWQSSGSINRVKIEDSNDNGQTFSIIDANVTNNSNGNSEYLWMLPADANSDQYRIRISDKNNADTNDISNNVFTIFKCDAALTADLSGDCYVDFEDFVIFGRQWLTCGNLRNPNWCQ